jgi:hypothetical protein
MSVLHPSLPVNFSVDVRGKWANSGSRRLLWGHGWPPTPQAGVQQLSLGPGPDGLPLLHYLRIDLKTARISSENSFGSSQAAKCPPRSTSLK